MTPSEALSWGRALKKVVSTKHKATILRVAHHDVYTKERVTRYGLGNDQTCSEIEDLRHKLVDCNYVRRIWSATFRVTDKVAVAIPVNNVPVENKILGATSSPDKLVIAIHAEILQRIIWLRHL